MSAKQLQRNKMLEKGDKLKVAARKARMPTGDAKPYNYPIVPPQLIPGVVPKGEPAPVLATDSPCYNTGYNLQSISSAGFPGFQYLAQLATRAEYRAMASAKSTEMTREWITFTSQQDDGDESSADKIKAIEAEFKRLKVRDVIRKADEHDSLYGRGQIFIDIEGADIAKPLILDKRTVGKESLKRINTVEAVWTTPNDYNALEPQAANFYKPSMWFMLGQQVHASRLMTVISRELPDILKPAYNFAGMSLSQLAEPYVDNWLRTRQSVADLINNFSITALATSMEQVLQGTDDGTDLFARADLFTATRSNRGLMLLDKDHEELSQLNTPLSGLHELQAQAQEHMCAVSRLPAIILTGISPSGLNASSDGEIRVFYDWIAAQQEACYRDPIEVILKVVQLSLFGEIDPNIGFAFNPLYQMTPKELAEIREIDHRIACGYADHSILDTEEIRDKLAKDPDSGFHGLDVTKVIEPSGDPSAEGDPEEELAVKQQANDEFKESDHPCAENGQFGSGGGGKSIPGFGKMGGDPAEVNIPLGKRGDINKQLDKYKAGESKQKKQDAQQRKNQFDRTKDLAGAHLEKHREGLTAKYSEKYGPAQLKALLDDMLKSQPDKLNDLINSHLGETSKVPYADHNGDMRSPGLTPKERKVEDRFYKELNDNPEKMVAGYFEKFGSTIDPDASKTMSPDFAADPNLAAAVHEPSSKLAKMLFDKALADKKAAGDTSPTVFTAGGSGSGKSTTMSGSLAALGGKPDGLLYDSVLSSPASAKSRIDKALAATEGDVGIAYTNANIDTALTLNALRKRSVTIDTLAHAHAGAAETLRELADHCKDNPRVKISVMNNFGKIEDVAPGDISDVPSYEKFSLRNRLVGVAKGLLDNGIIDQEKYEHLLK